MLVLLKWFKTQECKTELPLGHTKSLLQLLYQAIQPKPFLLFLHLVHRLGILNLGIRFIKKLEHQ